MASEVEETLKRIQSHRGVIGTIVVNNEGTPIKSTLDNATTIQYAGLIQQLIDKSKSVVRDLDPSNDLMFLRMRTKKHEIMVSPGWFTTFLTSLSIYHDLQQVFLIRHKDFIMIVIQNPTEAQP
ncbi:dynein light chain roadblock-type 2-like isoform X1 [Adelges cooleyi]|uniref:dynein light chain roadblock-type 2-like isoform X1 n=1 Tax=Adelges cooleyi TaxID=133065 RepID=UPI0021801FE9|nr:dynein light chain roadblock-type 2-like isoform X1 [Adelges cooleyi]XP_050420894.1 dynein light chain roadblock-type 2-like isoform X1 [Adelges cooleyi]